VRYSSKTQEIVRLAYFSGNPYYNMPLPVSQGELLKEMRRYGIKYYFHFKNAEDESFHFTDESGSPFPEVTSGRLKGLNIFLVSSQ
jgi:hypothetical protein